MTPSQLRDYLKQNRHASLNDLSIHFSSSPESVKAAMAIWIKKGLVSVTAASACKKSCCSCKPENITIYHWQEKSVTEITPSLEIH